MRALLNVHSDRVKDSFLEEEILPKFRAAGFEVEWRRGDFPEGSGDDLMVTLGGDGTFLKGAREAWRRSCPILGVDVGFVGFLCQTNPEKLADDLELISSGNYGELECSVLRSKVIRDGRTLEENVAVNDVVVSKADISRLVHLRTEVNGEHLTTYRADGLIVATALGSTAYSMSAGGAILEPGLNLLQLTPICSHSLGVRPLVLEGTSDVTIQVSRRDASTAVTYDGQASTHLEAEDEVRVGLADKQLKMVEIPGRSYIEHLRKKLRWGYQLGES